MPQGGTREQSEDTQARGCFLTGPWKPAFRGGAAVTVPATMERLSRAIRVSRTRQQPLHWLRRWVSTGAESECEISAGLITERLCPDTVARAAAVFRKHGMCYFASSQSSEWVSVAREQATQRWKTNLSRLPGGDMLVGMEHGYSGLVHRARGCDETAVRITHLSSRCAMRTRRIGHLTNFVVDLQPLRHARRNQWPAAFCRRRRQPRQPC